MIAASPNKKPHWFAEWPLYNARERRALYSYWLLGLNLSRLRRRLHFAVLELWRVLERFLCCTGQIEVPVAYVEPTNGYCDVMRGDAKEAAGSDDGRRYSRIRRNHQIDDGRSAAACRPLALAH